MAIVMFALSITVYEIFAYQIKRQTFNLENESQAQGEEERDLRHSTGNLRFLIGALFFRMLTI